MFAVLEEVVEVVRVEFRDDLAVAGSDQAFVRSREAYTALAPYDVHLDMIAKSSVMEED